MSAIALTAAQIARVDPMKDDVRTYIATETITKGQAVYILTTGKVGVADANAAGKEQFRGIALQSVGAGQAVDVMHEGEIAGFTLSGMNADAIAYLSDTAGGLDTAASGTKTVRCGRVVTRTDKDATKVLRVFTRWDTDW